MTGYEYESENGGNGDQLIKEEGRDREVTHP